MERKNFNCPHCGKIISKGILKADSIRKTVTCPECGSQRNYKDGLRYTRNGELQRYLCRDCGGRFSLLVLGGFEPRLQWRCYPNTQNLVGFMLILIYRPKEGLSY